MSSAEPCVSVIVPCFNVEAYIAECLDSGKYKAAVAEDMAAGAAVGVNGTPAFFINGRMLTGAQPFEAFQGVIEEELALAGIEAPKVVREGEGDDVGSDAADDSAPEEGAADAPAADGTVAGAADAVAGAAAVAAGGRE